MPAIRTPASRHAVASENTPPDLTKRHNSRLRGPSRQALANRTLKRGASNVYPSALRSGDYPAEQVKRRQNGKGKAASIAPAPTTTPSKPSSSKSSETSIEPETVTFKIPSSELSGERSLDADIKGGRLRTFPRRLQRPSYKPVADEAIMAVAPETGDVPYTYSSEIIFAQSKEWFPDLAKVDISFDKSTLPSTYNVRMTGPKVSPPTHILAVRPVDLPTPSMAPRPCPIQLYPVHSLVMAFHCRNLPPFSPSEAGERVCELGEEINVPSRYLCLPSPQTFPIILKYLYTQDRAAFLQSLLSAPPPPPVVDNDYASVRGFGTRLGMNTDSERIQTMMCSLISVWKNTIALGIVDDTFWESLDIAWEAVLCAFAMVTEQPEVMGLIP